MFCDFENVALGVREAKYAQFDMEKVLERLLAKGSIVVKKAYCDWERYKEFKAAMHGASFELIEIPHVRQSGKNSADIRLVVDALDLCYTKAHVNTFVIISGDSDFSPLVSKLRENNKVVIGVGVKQSTSDLLTANCDEFIFYDDLVREVQRNSAARRTPPPPPGPKAGNGNVEEDRKREEMHKRRAKGVELAVETLEALASERADGSKIWSSVLKEAIKRRRPDFNESYFGFRGFSHLLEEAQARGLLELARDEKSNVHITRTSAPVPTSGEAPAPVPGAPEALPITHRAGEGEGRERGRRRGGRGRNAPERHDFEPAVALDAPAEGAPALEQEDDDIAERFADVARDEQAVQDVVLPEPVLFEPSDDESPEAAEPTGDADAPDARAPRRGSRGGRGRGTPAKKTPRTAAAEPAAEAPAAPPAANSPPEGAARPARKAGARKTAGAKSPRAPRKTAKPAE